MSGPEAIAAVTAVGTEATSIASSATVQPSATAPQETTGFAELLNAGVAQVETNITQANAMVRQFAIDETVPVHEVMMALEEARLSVELAMQVRSRMVEAYREIMNMQI